MSQEDIRNLLPHARHILKGKQTIKARQLCRLLDLESTTGNIQLVGRVLTHLPEWKRANMNGRYEKVDIKTASYRLSITLSEEHQAYLEVQKQKFGLSYAAQIRSLLTQRQEGYIPQSYTATPSFSGGEISPKRSFMKTPDASNVSALNLELKALFAQRRLPCQQTEEDMISH